MTMRVLAFIIGHAPARAARFRIENDWNLTAARRLVRHAAATYLPMLSFRTSELFLDGRRITWWQQWDQSRQPRQHVRRSSHYRFRIFRSLAM